MEGRDHERNALLKIEQTEHNVAATENQFNGILTWGGRKVPDAFFSHSCASHVEMIGQDERAPMEALEHTAIPAWLLALNANLFLWAFWLVFPFFAFWGASCDGKGFAKAPSYLLCAFCPVLIISIYLELKCYRVMFPAILKHLGPYCVGGFTIPLEIWFAGAISVSIASHMDLATNGLFVARIAKTAMCHENNMDSVWQVVNKQSIFQGRLPRLEILCVGLWFLMAIQLVGAFYNSWPCEPQSEADLSLSDLTRHRRDKPVHSVFGVQTMGGQVWPSDAIQSLGESARMQLVNFRYLSFLVKARGPRLAYGYHCRRTWVRSIRSVTLRMFGVVLLENVAFANLQGTVLAIDKAIEHEIDWLTALSTILSLFSALYALATATRQLYSMVPLIWKVIDKKASKEPPEQPWLNKRTLITSISVFTVTAVLCLVGITYAFLKIYMTAVCPNGVWNLRGVWNPHRGLNLSSGCVELRPM